MVLGRHWHHVICQFKHIDDLYGSYLVQFIHFKFNFDWLDDLKIPSMNILENEFQYLTEELIPFCCVYTRCITLWGEHAA